jgi:hypothetical protein
LDYVCTALRLNLQTNRITPKFYLRCPAAVWSIYNYMKTINTTLTLRAKPSSTCLLTRLHLQVHWPFFILFPSARVYVRLTSVFTCLRRQVFSTTMFPGLPPVVTPHQYSIRMALMDVQGRKLLNYFLASRKEFYGCFSRVSLHPMSCDFTYLIFLKRFLNFLHTC